MGPGCFEWGGGMWGLPWLPFVFFAVLVLGFYFVFRSCRSWWGCRGDHPQWGPRETPLEILKRRYAGGEITREEFERMKREIA